MRFPLAGTVDGSIHEKHEDQHMNIGFVDPEQLANRIRFTVTKLNSCVTSPDSTLSYSSKPCTSTPSYKDLTKRTEIDLCFT